MLPLVPLGGIGFLWGSLRPLYHTAIHQAIDDADRTTLVSAENLLANLLEAVVCLTIQSTVWLRHTGRLTTHVPESAPALILRKFRTYMRLRWVSMLYNLQVVLPIAFVQDRLGLLSGFMSIAPLLFITYSVLALMLTSSQAKADKEERKSK